MNKWLLASPGLAALAAFIAGIAYTAYLSGFHYNLGFGQQRFVGFENYIDLFSDPTFVKALQVTVVFVITAAFIETALGTLLAYGLLWSHRRHLYTMLLTVPLLVPVVSYVVFWRFMLDFRRGALVPLADALGFSIPNFLGDPSAALWVIVALDVLQLTPFVVIIVLAGLLSISPEIFSAARVDGARGLSIAFRIAFPLAKYAILAALFLRLIDAFRIFAKVWLLTRGGPGDATTTLELYLFTRGIQPLDLGVASAVSIIVLALSMMAIAPYIYLVVRVWRS